MSKPQQPQQPKKRPVAPVAAAQPQRQAPAPTRGSSAPRESRQHVKQEMIYSSRNYQIMLGGLGLIVLGLLLMLGGRMPSPDVWEPNEIYSFRRITLAPMAMLIGFGVILWGIFYQEKKSSQNSEFKVDTTEEAEA